MLLFLFPPSIFFYVVFMHMHVLVLAGCPFSMHIKSLLPSDGWTCWLTYRYMHKTHSWFTHSYSWILVRGLLFCSVQIDLSKIMYDCWHSVIFSLLIPEPIKAKHPRITYADLYQVIRTWNFQSLLYMIQDCVKFQYRLKLKWKD